MLAHAYASRGNFGTMHHAINRYVTIGYSINAHPSCSGIYIYNAEKTFGFGLVFVQTQKSHYSLVSVQST